MTDAGAENRHGGAGGDGRSRATGEELLAETRAGVLWLTINRPDAGNAIPFYVRDTLTDHFRRAHADLAIRAVVLGAAGDRHFCTGADLRTRPDPPARPEGAPDLPVGFISEMMRTGFQALMSAIQDCEKPVIAAVNGTAAGGGMMLALAADLVIASERAKFVPVFVRRGLVADGGVAYLLPRLVGLHRAKELLFFGDDVPAARAEALGLVNAVVPPAELDATVNAWAQRLASGPTTAIGFTKRLLHDASEIDRRALLEEEARLVELNQRTADAQEGVASFVERREPHWSGW